MPGFSDVTPSTGINLSLNTFKNLAYPVENLQVPFSKISFFIADKDESLYTENIYLNNT